MPQQTNEYFVIYYLNYPKAVELNMTFGNTFKTQANYERTFTTNDSIDASLDGSVSAKVPLLESLLRGKVGCSSTDSESHHVAETYEVKHTKSTHLKKLIGHAKRFDRLSDIHKCQDGDLITIDSISLSPVDREQISQMQLLKHEALKGFRVEGFELNNIINSMLEDYSYILVSEAHLADGEDQACQIAIKIPSENVNEFESKYRMHDLLLGKVTLVGVYKGIVSTNLLRRNTFNSLQSISTSNELHTSQRVIKSAKEASCNAIIPDSPDELQESIHYLDLIAILQPVHFNPSNEGDESMSEKQKNGLLSKVKGLFSRE